MANYEEGDGVWMEEDDYCQREVLPLSSISWCQSEISKIEDYATKHRVDIEPGLTTYSDMYVRGDSPTPLSSLGIRRVEFDDLMRSCSFQRHRVVGFDVPDSVAAYRGSGVKDLCSGVFIDWDENEVIQSIWFPGPLGPEDEDLMGALQHLGQRYPLLYVDWAWGLLGAIDGGPDLQQIAARRNRS